MFLQWFPSNSLLTTISVQRFTSSDLQHRSCFILQRPRSQPRSQPRLKLPPVALPPLGPEADRVSTATSGLPLSAPCEAEDSPSTDLCGSSRLQWRSCMDNGIELPMHNSTRPILSKVRFRFPCHQEEVVHLSTTFIVPTTSARDTSKGRSGHPPAIDSTEGEL